MKRATLVAAFGTADRVQMERSFLSMYEQIAAVSEDPCVFALSSERIRKRLDNAFPTVKEAFLSFREQGVREVRVIMLYLTEGVEYRKVRALCDEVRPDFDRVTVAAPLLPERAFETAQWFARKYPATGHPMLLLGHGLEDGTDPGYGTVEKALHALGRTDMTVRLLHEEKSLRDGILELKEGGAEAVEAIPFMLSAGHHIQEAFAELHVIEEECGVPILCREQGMGEDPEMTELFI